jgi:hypothetical protein
MGSSIEDLILGAQSSVACKPSLLIAMSLYVNIEHELCGLIDIVLFLFS